MSIYSYCMFIYLHRASWHSSATLTEGFPCFFLSCKANARVKPAKMGHGPHYSKFLCCFLILFVLCRPVYCLCVIVYCTTATGWLPNCSLTNTVLFKMIVGVLTTCHTKYTRDRSVCPFLFNRTTLQVLVHTLQVLCMCTVCDSTDINTIIEFFPNCLLRVSGDGFNGGSDSYLQFRDTCGKRRNINLILDVNT